MTTRKPIRPVNGPVRLDRLAESLLDPLVSKAGFSSTQILAAWPQIVGPELAERSRPEKLRWPPRRALVDVSGDETGEHDAGPRSRAASDGATLVVRAEAGEALELQYASDRIVARINAIFGWKAVSRLTIRQAPVETSGGPARGPADDGEGGGKRPDPSNIKGLEGVADADLRDSLARLGARIETDDDTKA